MAEILKEGFNPGGIKDTPDYRDFSMPKATASFDFVKGFDIEAELKVVLNQPAFRIPVKNQNGSFSCGGQAWSYLGEVLEALRTKTFEERSAKFIYAQTNHVPGGGSAGRVNCDLVIKQGWGHESLTTSYDNGLPPTEPFMIRKQDITPAATAKAAEYSAFSYEIINADINDVAWAIQQNHGVIIGITGENNGTWYSPNPKPPTGTNLWNHWVFAGKVGMYNGKRAIGILNSWGDAIGDKGWQWIDEDYFKAGFIFSVWVIKTNHTFTYDLEFGMESSEVSRAQVALRKLGFYNYTVTGFFGNITKEAVKKFQLAHGIAGPVTVGYGRIGPKTRAKLNEIFG